MRERPIEQDRYIRRGNFDPVEENLTLNQVKSEANRCLSCKNPRCVKGCPVNIQIPALNTKCVPISASCSIRSFRWTNGYRTSILVSIS